MEEQNSAPFMDEGEMEEQNSIPIMDEGTVEEIMERYVLGGSFRSGPATEVSSAINEHTGETLAIKLGTEFADPSKFMVEEKVYKELNIAYPKYPGFCTLRQAGIGEDNYIVIDKLGPDLQALLESCNGKFSAKTILMVAIQSLTLIEKLHSIGYLHYDFKPSDLLIGDEDDCQSTIYLIDFAESKKFLNEKGQHIGPESDDRYRQSVRDVKFSSMNDHNHLQLSRRDDLISLAYSLIFFYRGGLPWDHVSGRRTDPAYQEAIFTLKKQNPIQGLCDSFPELKSFVDSVTSLAFEEKPDYDNLRSIFQEFLRSRGFTGNERLDWMDTQAKE